MSRARSVALVSLWILVAVVPLWTAPALAQADGRWALSLGIGPADQFSYRTHSFSFGDYSEHFGFSGLAVVGAAYGLTDHVSFRADAGYLGYQKELGYANVGRSTAGILGTWPSGSALTVQMPFVSAGVRLYALGPASTRPSVYIEALPTLWVTRWRERVETPEHYDVYGNYYPSQLSQDAFTTLDPGFSAGAGFLGPLVGRTKLDIGFRYLFSTGAGQQHLGQFSSGNFKGLRQLALVMSVHRAI